MKLDLHINKSMMKHQQKSELRSWLSDDYWEAHVFLFLNGIQRFCQYCSLSSVELIKLDDIMCVRTVWELWLLYYSTAVWELCDWKPCPLWRVKSHPILLFEIKLWVWVLCTTSSYCRSWKDIFSSAPISWKIWSLQLSSARWLANPNCGGSHFPRNVWSSWNILFIVKAKF